MSGFFFNLLRVCHLGLAMLCACLLQGCGGGEAFAQPVIRDGGPQHVASPNASSAALQNGAAEGKADFQSWVTAFRQRAGESGISAELFDNVFRKMTPDDTIARADRSQPEYAQSIWAYLGGALSIIRVKYGQTLQQQNASLLEKVEARYGVDREVLLAVWGLESNFGRQSGRKQVLRSLATLAWEGRRPAFAEEQLLAALKIVQHGDITAADMLGSWAGAMGQPQFMPTTYHHYAVDFDHDGRRDIWNSTADTLASIANYLHQSGWQTGLPWGVEVTLPEGFDYALADPSVRKTMMAWNQLGVAMVADIDDSLLPVLDVSAYVLLPAGHRGPVFLALGNFDVILKYNRSSSYGMAVGMLAEEFKGRGGIQASWPVTDLPLSRAERLALQNGLNAKGFDAGEADGMIGTNTRKAIRAFQQANNLPADGYPSHELLKAVQGR